MSNYIPVEVPRESANDDDVYLVEWLVVDGQLVEAGTLLCVLESSKATFDCAAPTDGYVFLEREAGQNVPVGEVIATISSDPIRPRLNTGSPAASSQNEKDHPLNGDV